MIQKTFATVLVATAGIGIAAQGLASGATSRCRTVYAKGSDTSSPPSSVVAHVCDRIVVEFVIGTQGQVFPRWEVSRKPAKKVLKFVRETPGPSGQSTGSQDFHFRAVGRGRTRVSFKETTADPAYGTLERFTLRVRVLPRRSR